MAMTLDQVKAEVEAWYTPILGTFPDPDGAYGAQCKDLISHYIEHVHSEPYTRGNGIDMARNLISQRGWTTISATGKWQIGDVVSLNWGGYAGHVYVVIEDYGSKVKMVDLNGGPAPANSGPDEAVKVRVTSKTGVVGVARPPRYTGATNTAPAPAVGAMSTSSATISSQSITYHVASPSSASRGLVVYFDGDGMAKVSSQTADLKAMAAAANAKGFVFVAPKSPFSNVQWWDSADSQHDEVARAFIDWAAEKWGAAQLHLVGYSGGTVLLDKDLLNTGTWPAQYVGGALHIGGGSSTNQVSTPTSWRSAWPMRWVVGTLDVAGATVPADWSAKASAERARDKYKTAGHPTELIYVEGEDHSYGDMAGILSAYLPGVPTPAPAPTPTSTPTQILAKTLYNAEAIVAASARAGVPLWVAAAMIRQESTGRNVFGNDVGGVFSTPDTPDIEVTPARYAEFYARAIQPKIDAGSNSAGETSNGVGPAQITFWGFHRDAKAEGLDLTDPEDNIFYGLRILKGYLGGDYTEASVKISATRYNAGPSSTVVNKYGEEVWKYAVYYQGALGSATDPGTTDPGPKDPGTTVPPTDPVTIPPDPTPVVTVDPGVMPALTEAASTAPIPLPDPPPGPLRVAQPVTVPLTRVRWRDAWWWPRSVDVQRHLSIPGPDQSPLGAELVEATGSAELMRFRRVTRLGWSPWRDEPPVPGEPVWIDSSDDGGETWHRIFTGRVDDTGGAVDDFVVRMGLVDCTDDLDVPIEHPAIGYRHPSPDDGRSYMAPGMHPVYLTNYIARAAGYYCTAPATTVPVMLSVPMVGSMWPEHGTMFASSVISPKGPKEAVSADSPEAVRVPWGVTMSNTFSRYRPRLHAGVTGKMDRPLGVRARIGPTTPNWCFIELWWDRDCIVIEAAGTKVRVLAEQGWITSDQRNIIGDLHHTVTDEQAANGYEMDVWLSPNGDLTVIVDGVEHRVGRLAVLPQSMTGAPLDEVRLTTRPGHTQMGGVVIVSSADRSALEPWEHTFFPDVDTDHMIWGMPALAGESGRELLERQARAELSSMWFDEDGMLHYVGRIRMDQRESRGVLDDDAASAVPWEMGRSSIATHVDVTWVQPRMAQDRLSSGHTQTAWEGTVETLRPGEVHESVVSVPEDTDWVDVDGPFSNVGPTTVVSANRADGSWLGGTLVSDDESIDGLAVPVAHYRAAATRLDRRTFAVSVSYTPPPGVTAHMETATAEMSGLRKSLTGKGPILRARGVQKWAKASIKQVRATGLVAPRPRVYTHDGAWFVQTQKIARQIADRLAQMLAQPIPTWGPVEMASPDLSIRLGETRTLRIDQGSAPQRVSGIRFSASLTEGTRQSLTLRQLRP